MNFKFLIVSLLSTFYILHSTFLTPVFAQTLGSNCDSYLIDGQTPADHGPLYQGQTYNFSITMSNVGDITWSPTVDAVNPFPFRLGTQLPQDDTNWGTLAGADTNEGFRPNRIELTRDVPPGDSYTFNFAAHTPQTAGTYLNAYQMVWEGNQWFGAICRPSLQVDNSAVIPTPTPTPPPPTSCSTPGVACGECVGERCSNGDQCATGHTYCVFDPNGNYCGPCQGHEVDNCAAQCNPAPPPGPGFDVGPSPAGLAQIQQTFVNVVGIVVALGFVALFVLLTWAGFKYLTSGGEPKAIHAAHQTVTWALLGVIFLAIAWLILRLIEAFTGIGVTTFNIFVLPQ